MRSALEACRDHATKALHALEHAKSHRRLRAILTRSNLRVAQLLEEVELDDLATGAREPADAHAQLFALVEVLERLVRTGPSIGWIHVRGLDRSKAAETLDAACGRDGRDERAEPATQREALAGDRSPETGDRLLNEIVAIIERNVEALEGDDLAGPARDRSKGAGVPGLKSPEELLVRTVRRGGVLV